MYCGIASANAQTRDEIKAAHQVFWTEEDDRLTRLYLHMIDNLNGRRKDGE
jgi:hypothetical protein